MRCLLWWWMLWFVLYGCKSDPYSPRPYILAYPSYFGKPKLPQDNPLTQEGVALGKQLFFSVILSANQRVSCASCHKPEYGFADNRDFSLGAGGQKTAVNVPHLMNLAWNPGPWGWTGKAKTLREAIQNAILSPDEMNGDFATIVQRINQNQALKSSFERAFPGTASPIQKDNILKALEQYVLTLVSAQSRYDLWRLGKYTPTESEKRGFELFFKSPTVGGERGAGCGDCHSGHLTTNGLFANNGLFPVEKGREAVTQSPFDKGKFKIPSLRNVALTAPYMHNAKFKTLDEVIEHYASGVHRSEWTSPVLLYHHQLPVKLTQAEKQDLLHFLLMLTDTTLSH